MTDSHRFPRLSVQEEDFPLQLPDEFTTTFLEVVDSDGNVVALFCLVDAIEKRDFLSLEEFSQYYDELFFQHLGDQDWEITANIEGCAYPYPEDPLNEVYQITYKDLDLTQLTRGLSAYGRLCFPYNLDDVHVRIMWNSLLNTHFIRDLLRYVFSDRYQKYQGDLVEVLHFLFDVWGVSETHNRLRSMFLEPFADHQSGEQKPIIFNLDVFLQLDLAIIEPMASFLFTEDNIDEFIQAADKMNIPDLVTYLQHYKKKYLGYYFDGCPRYRFLESEFPERLPPGGFDDHVIADQNGQVIREYDFIEFMGGDWARDRRISGHLIDIINDAGETIALFYNVGTLNLEWFPDKLAFSRYYDELSADLSHDYDEQQGSDYYDYLLFVYHSYWIEDENEMITFYEKFLKMMRDHTVSSVEEFDTHGNIFGVGGDFQPEIFPSVELIHYGRLKYPYLLAEEAKVEYEKNIWRRINSLDDSFEELGFGTDQSQLTDKFKLLRFFLSHSKQKGKSSGISADRVIKFLIYLIIHRCGFDDLISFVEDIFDDQIEAWMIEQLIWAANKVQYVEVLAFLLAYQNKNFPPKGTAGLTLEL